MGKEVDLKKGELSRHVNKALKAISDGYIIAIPLEHTYAFACDAFKHDSVRAMNVLHGSPLFTSAQVLVGSSKTAQGVVREITPDISALMKKFWPGLLSLNLKPQLGLSWDLGDANQLDRLSIRVPKVNLPRPYLQRVDHWLLQVLHESECQHQKSSATFLFCTLILPSSSTAENCAKEHQPQLWKPMPKVFEL